MAWPAKASHAECYANPGIQLELDQQFALPLQTMATPNMKEAKNSLPSTRFYWQLLFLDTE